ncbi:uncharacterized protein TM35_000033820 [Trypanosoma theileri]|uniref:Uncharacterized protein n=1 Tax=Trypanosoma theileri TaxID=67003 RepID=A0A1X0P7T6_9TRYP|nr:uncharacterized protein TM35_000033820 [Trypanosoma theileri]ORC92629.1 hypothetical protein TM35_000033820 [Trypanosoma theileri]
MSRPPQPAPGRGRCFVDITRPAVISKWQSTQPEVHSVKVVRMDEALPHNIASTRPSKRVVEATVAGLHSALGEKKPSALNSIAMNNITAKKESEARMKTRDYAEHKHPAYVRPGWERKIDVVNLSEWMYARIHAHRKLINDNAKGYEKEYMMWEKKPDPPAVKK